MLGRKPSNMTDGIYAAEKGFYFLKPDIDKITRWPTHSFRIITNSYGFRDTKIGTPGFFDEYYFFLGDSSVFGHGVDYAESYVGVLSEKMEQHNVSILNLAVGGHHINDQLTFLRKTIGSTDLIPQKIFLGINPFFLYYFEDEHEDIITRNGYLFHKGSWLLPYLKIMAGNNSAAYCFLRDRMRIAQSQILPENHKENPVYFEVFSKSNEIMSLSMKEKMENVLYEYKKVADSFRAKLIIVYTPIGAHFYFEDLLGSYGEDSLDYDSGYYFRLLKDFCERNGLDFIDTTPELQSLYNSGVKLQLEIDAHYNGRANKIIGNFIYQHIDK